MNIYKEYMYISCKHALVCLVPKPGIECKHAFVSVHKKNRTIYINREGYKVLRVIITLFTYS